MTARATLVALLGVLGALVLAAGAGAEEPVRSFATRVSISEKYPAFHGRLSSKSAFCGSERPVYLYRVRPGKDQLLERRRSERDGTWQVSIGERLTSGAYYAEARAYGSASLGIVCPPARSKIVTVD
jgi:hypothetical protein